MLMIALQMNIQYGYTQDISLNTQSFKNNFNDKGNWDTNLNLREAILRIKKTCQVDILFDDAVVSGLSVSSSAAWSKSMNAEDALNKLLKDFQLKFKKVKKDTYIIVAANATSKQVKKQISEKMNTDAASQQDNEQANNEKSKNVTTPDKNVPAVSVNGVVVDETDKPLSGVSVTVKGTQKGTTTNNNGRFSIDVDNENAVLIFSTVGYETQEIKITNNLINLRIVLKSLSNV